MHRPAKQAAKALKFHPNNNFYERRMAFIYVKTKNENKVKRHQGQKSECVIILDEAG